MTSRSPIAAAILVAYLLALLDLTLFQFAQHDPRPNLVPFRSIAKDMKVESDEFLFNFVGNLVAFVPFGVLLPLVWPGWSRAGRVVAAAAVLSAAIEVTQYASGRRVADVDDVLLNSTGALLGYGILVAARGRRGSTAKE